jgi:predicted N-acyltransferase
MPRAEWDALATRGLHLHRWFVAAERSGWQPRHLQLRGASGLTAIVPVYLADHGSSLDLRHRWLGPMAAAVGKAGLDLRPTIAVQSAFSPVSDPLGCLESVSDSALHKLLETLERQAVEDDAVAAVWPFVDVSWGERLLQVGRARGWIQVYAGATARLAIRWGSFEEYLASRSEELRGSIERELEWLQREAVQSTCVPDFGTAVAQIDGLWGEGFRCRHGKESAASGFFRALAKPAEPGIAAQLTSKEGRLIATGLGLAGRQMLDLAFAAFDSEVQGGPVYFNNLVYLPIRMACAAGVSALDLGPTALYPKVLRGATLHRRMTLIRGTTPACHQLLRAIGELAGRRQQWRERRALGALRGTLRAPA